MLRKGGGLMPENDGPAGTQPTEPGGSAEPADENVRPVVTRRDFIAGAGLGVAATAIVAGGVAVATRQNVQTVTQPVAQTGPGGAVVQAPAPAPNVAAQPPTQAQPQTQAPAPNQLPLHLRRVTLNIDGISRDVVVDVRETLWQTTTQKLGLNGINLGCDRSQCGACAVVIDGKAVNGCSVYSARLGRGQKIQTIASLPSGPGVEGLHPIQRAFWMQGGFQCGICTRGFIMSSYALLTANPSPTRPEIAEALSGNICRCGEYVKVYNAVEAAAAEMKNPPAQQQVLVGPPPPHQGNPATATFQFVNPLGSDEFIGEVNNALIIVDGVNGVSGNSTTATVSYWPDQVNEDQLRKAFSDAGYAVK